MIPSWLAWLCVAVALSIVALVVVAALGLDVGDVVICIDRTPDNGVVCD